MISSRIPVFRARFALCSTWFAGAKRYWKKSRSVGFAGIFSIGRSFPSRFWHEEVPRAAPAGAAEILVLGLQIGNRGELRRLVELLLHVVLEGIGFLLRGHDGEGGGPAHTRDEGTTIDFHVASCPRRDAISGEDTPLASGVNEFAFCRRICSPWVKRLGRTASTRPSFRTTRSVPVPRPKRDPPRPEVPGYEIERQLGAGSYGEVWLAIHKNTGRKVAIKFFSRFKGLDWPLLKREVGKLVEVVGERRVVHLLHVGWDADPPYYVMEFLPGGSLADRLTGRTLPVRDTVGVVREVAEALVYLHGKAILHCDLKPANVLLDDHGQIRLADFGQARLSSEAGPAVGTLFYMAPEQADASARPDVRSDIYSLGALAYTMLTGKPPFARASGSEELSSSRSTRERIERYKRLIDESPPPTEHHRAAGVDRALADIVDRCLREGSREAVRERAHRFSNLSPSGSAARRESLSWSSGYWVLSRFSPRSRVWAFWPSTRRSPARAPRSPSKPSRAAEGYADLIAAVVDRNLSAVKRQVERETVDADLVRLLERADGAARSSLQSRTDALYQSYRDRHIHNWVIADANAVVLARTPFDERVVGSRYAYREWFSGSRGRGTGGGPGRDAAEGDGSLSRLREHGFGETSRRECRESGLSRKTARASSGSWPRRCISRLSTSGLRKPKVPGTRRDVPTVSPSS